MTSRALLLLALLLASAGAQAQIYRWVDQNGRVQYSNQPPPKNVKSTIVDPDAKAGPPAPDTADCYTIRCQGERMEERQRLRDAEEAKLARERTANAAKQPRGLDFRAYVSIRKGMTEGELLGIAGEPDFVSDQGVAYDVPGTVQVDRNLRVSGSTAQRAVNWTYMPTPADPFTTTITLIGGRVSDLDRQRKF
jgi:hypothetical protein